MTKISDSLLKNIRDLIDLNINRVNIGEPEKRLHSLLKSLFSNYTIKNLLHVERFLDAHKNENVMSYLEERGVDLVLLRRKYENNGGYNYSYILSHDLIHFFSGLTGDKNTADLISSLAKDKFFKYIWDMFEKILT